ncbi:ATP-binding protein [Lachnoclostridium sp. An14]|nr:ATP-binding protein [Lachnoclostridium sp. An14]
MCDKARTTKGSGVGLYVVKWIAEQYGGKVTAANEGGLAIRLYFPMGE